ncbi:GntR family transcriptional regulator [Paraclostridium bifermentans]|jgi:GntR family transcriptional regulator|uniref:Bacterial regulatory s, gntR family protein n=1 Tax=Paraclostridium bifermentans ATCC 638 = DSM 14991 TaxID=1233171 RepID=T4VQ97_PARBF|nr:GntR family transcriptional regulator [Paraclostridium bifermentans]RDC48721.1 GntR family transcriptional regulator [Acinetobacter sp. RIT592]EQK42862.1 bacterial regulatory s, gntR family protein [[Clostridium] bifermentans ATCC 638] [Paraclostridium bifermentans ATCC 638 = DSM 14991]MBU5286710.1 GntR family transcriptional regulator [Paraclostridium bifermentans]MDO7205826.1 GntR family transcriptional regulator [Paraclostridium bifermentans]MDU3337091.1 GntR family transcriptional regul
MILNLDFNSDKPIYIQIREEVIKSIANGELEIYESLPSVRSLADEIGINLHTVSKAYNLLKDEGYISIDRRKGAVINNLPIDKDTNNFNQIKDQIELLVAESYLKGIDKSEFIDLCENYFEKYGVKK